MKPECCTRSEWDEIRSSAEHASLYQPMLIDDLCALLKAKFGKDFTITHRDCPDGSGDAYLVVDGVRRATWSARLINKDVPRDGITPRGPREHYGIRFFEPKVKPLHRNGVPMNVEDWTEQDWMDLNEAVQTAIEKIAARHKK